MKERELIESISTLIDVHPQDLLMGIGDDCAVVKKTEDSVWLLTMDTLVEAVHFDLAFHPPEKLGWKSLSVNISDIAAMGGRPVFVLLSLGLPTDFDQSFFARFSAGLIEACRHYGCVLIGGDTVRSPQGLTITITAIGEAAVDKVVYRRGARPGDIIWVSGPLGGAAAGLALCQAGLHRESDPRLVPLVEAHLDPRARAELGLALGRSGLVNAMMDLSDGLATDLAHICKQSNVGARLVAEKLPLPAAMTQARELLDIDPVKLALTGGEDYELLFTAASAHTERLYGLASEWRSTFYPVGTIVRGSGVYLQAMERSDDNSAGIDISYQGFDHFGSTSNQ